MQAAVNGRKNLEARARSTSLSKAFLGTLAHLMGNLWGSPLPPAATPEAAPATFSAALARWGGATIFPKTEAHSLLDVHHVYHPQELVEAPNTSGFQADRKRHQRLNRNGRQYYGQFMEDCFIRALIKAADDNAPDNVLGGNVYLEMGALNGIRYSNTLASEMSGWRGVMIEASPTNCELLKDNRRSGRGVNICAGVCGRGVGPLEFELIGSATSRMVKKPLPPEATAAQRAKRIQVPCLPLGQILRDLAITRITHFSLDVEGAELYVLRTIDWSAVRIDVLRWECSDKSTRPEINSLLASRGMRQLRSDKGPIKAHNDHLWISHEFAARLGNTSLHKHLARECPR